MQPFRAFGSSKVGFYSLSPRLHLRFTVYLNLTSETEIYLAPNTGHKKPVFLKTYVSSWHYSFIKFQVRLSGLLHRSLYAANLEVMNQKQKNCLKQIRKTAVATMATAPYDSATYCWRCKQQGHTRLNCKRTAQKFCSQCGKNGVLTRDCHSPSRNNSQADNNAATFHIQYRPQPHLQVHILDHIMWALLDLRSNVSLINATMVDKIVAAGKKLQPINEQVIVVNDSYASVSAIANLTIKIGGCMLEHCFRVLPTLESDILLGTDLWTKLQITLPPSPQKPTPTVTNTVPTVQQTPELPRPVRINLPDGEIVEVPHVAVYKSRRFKARISSGRWLIRFDRQGRPLFFRKIPNNNSQKDNGVV